MFVRVDKVKLPLVPPYEGPYEVVAKHPKYFVIYRKGREDKVSIDRLKPAQFIPEPKSPSLSDRSNNVSVQDIAEHSTNDDDDIPPGAHLNERCHNHADVLHGAQ